MEKSAASTKLYLENYHISKINIELNGSFRPKHDLIEINPFFTRSINKIDANKAYVVLSVSIEKNEERPFFGEIVIQGLFRCDEWEETEDGKYLMSVNATAILFPFLRQALANATMLLNVPPYFIPVVNVQTLFGDKNK